MLYSISVSIEQGLCNYWLRLVAGLCNYFLRLVGRGL